jgi:hypothetical protein
MQLVLRAVGGLSDTHLRHRHLRHVHEGLDAVMARHRGGVDRGLQTGRRDRHAEIDARAVFDSAVHRGEIRQVALHGLGAEPAQGAGALVLPPDQGAYLVALGEQHCGELRPIAPMAPAAPVTRDRAVVCGFHHVAGLKLRSEGFCGVRSFVGEITGLAGSLPAAAARASAFGGAGTGVMFEFSPAGEHIRRSVCSKP